MIERYSRDAMAELWTPQAKYDSWLMVERAVVKALADLGEITPEEATLICEHAAFSIPRINAIEAKIHHDLQAFVESVQETLRAAGLPEPVVGMFHKKTTSYDTEDPALMVTLGASAQIIRNGLGRLRWSLLKRAHEHKYSLMIARTHGQYAQPDTFGRLLLVYVEQMENNLARLEAVRSRELNQAKLSGAVGNYANVSPGLEELALEKLGLEPVKAATQIVQRDRHSAYADVLATIATCIEQMCRTLWEMARSEINEVEEGRGKEQKGSSAMPQKKNPILLERLQGLAIMARKYAEALKEVISTPEGRDLIQSGVERIAWPDLTILVDYMLDKAATIIDNLVINADVMEQRLDSTRGVWASQAIRNALISAGLSADQAYAYIQRLSFRVQKEGVSLFTLIATERLDENDDHSKVGIELIGAEQLAELRNPRLYIEVGVDTTFDRFPL